MNTVTKETYIRDLPVSNVTGVILNLINTEHLCAVQLAEALERADAPESYTDSSESLNEARKKLQLTYILNYSETRLEDVVSCLTQKHRSQFRTTLFTVLNSLISSSSTPSSSTPNPKKVDDLSKIVASQADLLSQMSATLSILVNRKTTDTDQHSYNKTASKEPPKFEPSKYQGTPQVQVNLKLAS